MTAHTGQSAPGDRAFTAAPESFERLLAGVRDGAAASGVFAGAEVVSDKLRGRMLRCPALASAEPAEFRVFFEGGRVWLGLVTEARWLSQSIEADLVHTGDKMEDLIEEELIDQGLEGMRLSVEHFRDDAKLFTFRSALPLEAGGLDASSSIDRTVRCLLAYEAAFRPLGDMEAHDDE